MPGWWGRRGSGVNGCSLYLILVVDDQRPAPDAFAMLLAELEDFVSRHRACGQLTGDATEPEPCGYLLWVRCSRGVSFLRWVALEEAALEVLGHTQSL